MTEDTVAKGQAWNSYPPKAQEIIIRLANLQHRLAGGRAMNLAWNDSDFVDKSGVFKGQSWYQLKRGIYPAPSSEARFIAKLTELSEHVDRLMREVEAWRIRTRRAASLASFVPFAEWEALCAAVALCKERAEEGDQERVVWYVAPTGGGKTTAAKKLVDDGIATWRVAATPCWERSYLAVLTGIADGLGMTGEFKRAAFAEKDVLSELRAQNGVLAIEEIELLCDQGMQFLRTVLNETTCSLVIFITPEFHRKLLRRGGMGVAQLIRRSAATIEARRITPAMVRRFGAQVWDDVKDAGTDPRLSLIADEANKLGAFSAVQAIHDRLRAAAGASGTITMEDVVAAVGRYRDRVPAVNTERRKAA